MASNTENVSIWWRHHVYISWLSYKWNFTSITHYDHIVHNLLSSDIQSVVSLSISLGETARWLQLQPSSSWPRPTVSAFQYFRWCALTKLAVSHFLHQIYSPSKEEALQSLLMSLSTLVFWLFDEENIRRHDGCSKWWRWLQLMFRERWRGLHDSFDELVPLITQDSYVLSIFET